MLTKSKSLKKAIRVKPEYWQAVLTFLTFIIRENIRCFRTIGSGSTCSAINIYIYDIYSIESRLTSIMRNIS